MAPKGPNASIFFSFGHSVAEPLQTGHWVAEPFTTKKLTFRHVAIVIGIVVTLQFFRHVGNLPRRDFATSQNVPRGYGCNRAEPSRVLRF
jgi:hypothetical protein